jgi:hypothetical protein
MHWQGVCGFLPFIKKRTKILESERQKEDQSLTLHRSLSYLEQRLTLARMIWNFDLANADDAHDWDSDGDFKNIKAYSTWQKPGLNVVATDLRKAESKYWLGKQHSE